MSVERKDECSLRILETQLREIKNSHKVADDIARNEKLADELRRKIIALGVRPVA